MTLIKSISGIRGTIGGLMGEGLSPIDIVKFTSGFAAFLLRRHPNKKLSVVIGRDARISGEMMGRLVSGTLLGMGIDVRDCGLSTTPSVEMEVVRSHADGGIILTASHNPMQWNALKLLHEKGEFLNEKEGLEVLSLAECDSIRYAEVSALGTYSLIEDSIQAHIQEILSLKLVDRESIRSKGFKIAIDCVNSTGGIAIPQLLRALGVTEIVELYCEPNGVFPHNPEPLPEHLKEIAATVKRENCDLGFVVDPDVDRLAIICEDGSPFGEEYSLVAIADYMLSFQKGHTVSNLSSSQALRDLSLARGGTYSASAVGEVHVVAEMKRTKALLGGEGNGGIIIPELHYGRDALVGIALFLSLLAKKGLKCSALRKQYPDYTISKNKIEFSAAVDHDTLFSEIQKHYSTEQMNLIDGLKIEWPLRNEWVHLRRSNTEPIIRIYAESISAEKAGLLAESMKQKIQEIIDRI